MTGPREKPSITKIALFCLVLGTLYGLLVMFVFMH